MDRSESLDVLTRNWAYVLGYASAYRNRFKGLKTMDVCDTSYLMVIQHILDKISPSEYPFPTAGANHRVTLAEFLTKINEEANKEESAIRGIYVPEEIVNGIDSGELKLSNMTVAQFDAIEGAIRELYTLGRNVASMELDGERVAFESARSDISHGIVDNLTKKGKGKLENRERTG